MTQTTEITVSKLKEVGDVSTAIEFAKSFYPKAVDRPKKPTLGHNHTVEDVKNYAVLLEKYDADMEKYKVENGKRQEETTEINSVIVEFIKEASGLKTIPEQYQEKTYSFALETAHSRGYYDVYLFLCDMVEIFK